MGKRVAYHLVLCHWSDLALLSLFNNQQSANNTAEQPSGKLLKDLKTFLQT